MSDSSSPASASTIPLPDSARNAEGPVLVALSHPLCGACLAAKERLKQLKARVGTSVTVERINVAEVPEVAEALDVEEVPTLLAFQNGRLRARLVGTEKIQAFADEVAETIAA
jgi:thioredoxin-like negative regulator of GroEL